MFCFDCDAAPQRSRREALVISPAESAEASDELRREGLRILARIIARRYLKQPQGDVEPDCAAAAPPKNPDRRSAAGPHESRSNREDAR